MVLAQKLLFGVPFVLAAVLLASAGTSQQPPDLSNEDRGVRARTNRADQAPGEQDCPEELNSAREKIELQEQLIDKLKERIEELEERIAELESEKSK